MGYTVQSRQQDQIPETELILHLNMRRSFFLCWGKGAFSTVRYASYASLKKQIIYRDSDIIAINKRFGQTVQVRLRRGFVYTHPISLLTYTCLLFFPLTPPTPILFFSLFSIVLNITHST